jgi:hypothetical protein
METLITPRKILTTKPSMTLAQMMQRFSTEEACKNFDIFTDVIAGC